MKKAFKIISVVLFIAFVAIQFLRPDFSNPPIVEAETIESTTEVPESIRQILQTSCNDCHTNKTVYPWYSKVTPVSWWLADHIIHGREKLNFSVWNTYQPKRKAHKLEEICEMIQAREMPLPSYLWVHWDAKLSDEKIKLLCDWANLEKIKIEKTAIDSGEK